MRRWRVTKFYPQQPFFDFLRNRLFPRAQEKENFYVPLLTIFLLMILFFTGITGRGLWTPDEPRVAEIGREMVMSGNYAIPTLNKKVFLEKPPLYFASVALVYKLIGGAKAYEVRIPNAIFGFLTALLVLYWATKLFSPLSGFFASLVLSTTVLFYQMSHWGIADVALTFFITVSLFGFWEGITKDQKYFYLFYVGIILAFYTKGLIGMIIPGITVLTFLGITKNLKTLLKMKLIQGTILFSLSTLPWIIALYHYGGTEYLKVFFIVNHFNRFFAHKGIGHIRPFYYYFYNLPFLFIPWSFFAPIVAITMYKRREWMKNKAFLLFLCWAGFNLVLLTLSSTKRNIYVLPLFPPLAILFAHSFTQWNQSLFSKKIQRYLFALAIVICITEIAILSMPVYILKHILASIIFLFLFFLFFYIAWGQIKQRHPIGTIVSFILLMVALLSAIPFCLYPSLDKYKNYKPYIKKLMESVPKYSTVYLYKPNETMCALFPFYLDIYPKEIETPKDAKIFLGKDRDRVLAVFDRKGHLQKELEHIGLSPEEKVVIYKKRCLLLYAYPGISRKFTYKRIHKPHFK